MPGLQRMAIAAGVLLGCGGPVHVPTPPPDSSSAVTAEERPAVRLQRDAHALTLVPAATGAVAYLQSEENGVLLADLLWLDAAGSAVAGPSLTVKGFSRPLGEVVAFGGGLFVPVIRSETETDVLLELWWAMPGAVPRLRLACSLPWVAAGQVLVEGADLLVLFEDGAERLAGFRTSSAEPTCPGDGELATLQDAPLPDAYRFAWLAADVALTGRSADAAVVRLFDRDLRPLRRFRLASAGTRTGVGLWVGSAESGQARALFAAERDGASDLYAADLEQLTAGPLADERVVATAEVELRPDAIVRDGQWVLTWTVRDGEGTLELGGTWAPGRPALPGGEVLWRRGAELQVYDATWTDAGRLRGWVEGTQLRLSLYRPSFW